MFRFLYVTDLHGWTAGYEAMLDLAIRNQIGTIVNGGDMLPKEADLFREQEAFLNGFLRDHLTRCRAEGVRYLGMLGNDDLRCHEPLWRQTAADHDNIEDLAAAWHVLDDDVAIRGCPFVPDYPFGLKDWTLLDTADFVRPVQFSGPVVSTPEGFKSIDDPRAFFADRPTLAEVLDGLADDTVNLSRAILVAHCPPIGLGLASLDPRMAALSGQDSDVGSVAVANCIDRHQPLLSLHGHIHESPDVSGIHTVRRGKTTCHQPGQRAPGQLTASIVSIDGRDVHVDRQVRGAEMSRR